MRKRKTSQQPNFKGVRAFILGKDGVGKSDKSLQLNAGRVRKTFIVRFLTRRFITEYDQNSEKIYHHHLEMEREELLLDLMDTAGENTYSKLERCSAEGDVFFILYSITDRASFEEARRVGRFVKDRKKKASPITLVGTKRDLEHFRKISETEGRELAGELGSSFREISTSSANGYQEVSDMVNDCLKKYLNREKDAGQDRRIQTASSLAKMKEGLIRRTGSFRKKSVY